MLLRETGGVKKPKKDNASFWDNFVSSFESNAKQAGEDLVEGIGNAAEATVNFARDLGESAVGVEGQRITTEVLGDTANFSKRIFPEVFAPGTGAGTITKLQDFAQTREGKFALGFADVVTSPVVDPLLLIAKYIEPVWSYGIARPLSTFSLATDAQSQLYKDGFQLNDLRQAWNRSETVSFGQAFAKSDLFSNTPAGSVGNYALSIFGPDVDDIDLWEDKSVEKYYDKNPIGKIYSGGVDAALNIFGGLKIDAAARSLIKLAGASTTIETFDDLIKLENAASEHINFINSGGVSGQFTNFGNYVDTLAKTDNIELATNITKLFSTNTRLPELFVKAKDPQIISDIILADKGYVPSLKRLLETDSDILFSLGDMRSYIIAKHIDDPIQPLNDELLNLQKAYDTAIERNSGYKEIWDTFMDESGMPKMQGNAWMPTTVSAIESVRLGGIKTRSAISSGNFADTNTFITKTLGSDFAGGPVTVLVKQAISGLPRGYVRNNNINAFENIREISSTFDDLRFIRNNTKTLKVESFVGPQSTITYRTATVAEVRDSFLKRFAATKPEDIPKFIDQFDEEMARLMSLNLDVELDFVLQVFKDARLNSNKFHSKLRENGYFFDKTGNRVAFEPAFVRQLADSLPMLPYREIETALLRSKMSTKREVISRGGELVKTFGFTIPQRLFSTNILYTRPAYTLKNSVMAPLNDELMYFGKILSDGGFGASAGRFFANRQRRIEGIVAKVKMSMPNSEYKKVSKEIEGLAQAYENAVSVREEAVIEYMMLASGKLSPTVAKVQGKSIVTNLEEIDKIVNKIERNLNVIAPAARTGKELPTIYELYRRVEYIRTNGSTAAAAQLDAKVQAIIEKNLNWTPAVTNKLDELDKEIKRVIDESEKILNSMGLLKDQQADELLKVLPYKLTERGYEGTFDITTALGNKITIDDLYAENQFGEAMRAEMSASITQQLTMTNEIRLAQNSSKYTRLTTHGVVRPSDPEYFEQLAHYANRFVRNDKLATRILNIGLPDVKKGANAPLVTYEDVLNWTNTKEGKEYFNALGVLEKDISSTLATQFNNIENYFPTLSAREQLLKGEVDAANLQKLLGKDLAELSPITSTDFDATVALMNKPSEVAADWVIGNIKRAEQALVRTFATKPEDAIARFPGGGQLFRGHMERRLNLLEAQGLPVKDYNALRQSAVAESVEDMKNIFYSIDRQNRAIFATRVLASFPQAFVSGVRRYTKFSLAHPGRALIGLQTYRDSYESFGVDSRGNDVPIEEAKFIVLPFSREIQTAFGIPGATGVLLPRNAFNYVLNSPGASFLVAVSAQSMLRNKPNTAQDIENMFGEAGMKWLFPSGAVEDNPLATFFSSYQKDLYNLIRSNESNADWLRAHVQAHKYLFAEWEASGKLGEEPTDEQSAALAKRWFAQRFLTKFLIGFGAKVDSPGQVGNDVYRALLAKSGNNPEKAREMMEDKFGSWASWYTISSNQSNFFVPPTQASYERVWGEHQDLARDLIEIDPELVSVLVADIGDEFSSPVYNFLTRAKLPGTDLKVKTVLTVRQAERKKKIGDGWKDYIAIRRSYDAFMQSNGMTAMSDDLRAEFNFYVTGEDPTGFFREQLPDTKTLADLHPEWLIEFNDEYTIKTGFKVATALDMILNNKKFMKDNGKKPFWFAANRFMVDREMAVRLRESGEYTDSLLTQRFQSHIKENYGTPGAQSYNKKFYDFYIRYLENDKLKGLK
jgi:hypothetical protein